LLKWKINMKAWTGFLLALLLVAALVCVGGALWIHRGFRARSTPAPSEAYVARKIRNFAIPTSERRSKNTLDATPGNLQQARELFIEHCASCHGLDGSANRFAPLQIANIRIGLASICSWTFLTRHSLPLFILCKIAASQFL
jgi:cytochrome c553